MMQSQAFARYGGVRKISGKLCQWLDAAHRHEHAE
jgi:hypothetical protein